MIYIIVDAEPIVKYFFRDFHFIPTPSGHNPGRALIQ